MNRLLAAIRHRPCGNLVLSAPGLLAAVALIGFTGCSVLRHEAQTTESLFRSVAGNSPSQSGTNAVVELQNVVMREADLYVGAVAEATDAFRQRVPTLEARDLAQQWKLQQGMAAYINASGENPTVNAVDMVVLATLSRVVVESVWVDQRFGEAALPVLDTHRRLEALAWKTAETVLGPSDIAALRELIEEFRRQNPDLQFVAAMRLPELAAKLDRPGRRTDPKASANLLSLLYLNPLAGLDPATQAIQQTRILAQRITYYVQRMSMLWGWQAELTAFQIGNQPGTQTVLTNFSQVARASEVFAGVAESLPKLVDDQRQAAINQFFDRLARERSQLLTELSGEEARLRGLLTESRDTLQAGSQMATAVDTAIHSLDDFVRSVSAGDTNTPATPPEPSRPFDVLDYATTARQIGAAAEHLTALLNAARASEAQASAVADRASAEARGVLNHAFKLAALLILLLGTVQVAVIVVYRRFGRNLGTVPGTGPEHPGS